MNKNCGGCVGPKYNLGMIRVCFVCLGNICRSPTAEGTFLHLVEAEKLADRFVVDSAGTGDWHVGDLPDARTRAAALRRGLKLESRARQFAAKDFDRFDHILVMDASNRSNVLRLATTPEAEAKVTLFRSFDPTATTPEVPDPYHGTEADFDEVFEICARASRGFLDHLRATELGTIVEIRK